MDAFSINLIFMVLVAVAISAGSFAIPFIMWCKDIQEHEEMEKELQDKAVSWEKEYSAAVREIGDLRRRMKLGNEKAKEIREKLLLHLNEIHNIIKECEDNPI